jgi:5-methylthioribose kinase
MEKTHARTFTKISFRRVDMREIKLKDIAKINRLHLEIFSEQDEDYPDYRVIRPKEKAIDKILENITKDKIEQAEIYQAIASETFNTNDITFKPICDNLRKLGYKIILDSEE